MHVEGKPKKEAGTHMEWPGISVNAGFRQVESKDYESRNHDIWPHHVRGHEKRLRHRHQHHGEHSRRGAKHSPTQEKDTYEQHCSPGHRDYASRPEAQPEQPKAQCASPALQSPLVKWIMA